MPNYTENFNLKKPLQEEFYNIDDHNGNMDIIDEVLKALSEDSGVVISADEPEKGEVWIDTDDEGETGGAVTSVNGKTGAVELTATDVDAYTTGQVYTKPEVSDLLKEKSPTNHTHTLTDLGAASADHSHSLSSLGAAANNHTHSLNELGAASAGHSHTLEELGAAASAHAHDGADIVSGFDVLAANLGMTRIATGSYVGTGASGKLIERNPTTNGVISTTKQYSTLTFGFVPKVVIITHGTGTGYNNSTLCKYAIFVIGFDETGAKKINGYIPIAGYMDNGLISFPVHHLNTEASFSGTTLKWLYDAEDGDTGSLQYTDDGQMNILNRTYYWTAIG